MASVPVVHGSRKRGSSLSLCLTFVSMLCVGWGGAGAQTAHFSGAQSIVASSGLSNPHGVAVDASGNVYIADPGNNRVLKETLSGGRYVESTVASQGLNLPSAVAVDTSSNVFVADTANNRILKETLSGGTYTESVVTTTGLNYPLGIAVDQSDNLVITDSGNARVVKETYSAGAYTQSTVLSGPSWPDGVAVDANGVIYVCAPSDADVVKLTPAGNSYTFTHIDIGVIQPHGVAVDAAGNVYIADGASNRILKETLSGDPYPYTQSVLESSGLNTPQAIALDAKGSLYFNDPTAGVIYKLRQSGGSFESTPVGTQSLTVSLVFAFDTAGSIGTTAVVTQGNPRLDYGDAGTGTCTTNGNSHAYAIGDSCTVDVTFTPKVPGGRYGAAVLTNCSGAVIATGYVQGIGVGPQVTFEPGLQTSIPLSDSRGWYALAVDASGNLYITKAIVAYDPPNEVVKETWDGNGYTESVIATGLGYPTGVAVDGAGNVYIADQDNYAVYKETPSNGGYTQSVVDGTLGTVSGIAVDGGGNVYVGRGGLGIEKETLTDGSYSRSEIFYEFYARSISVDAAGTLYFADGSDIGIRVETPSGNGYVESRIANDYRVDHFGIDGVGNVFIDEGAAIIRETLSGGGYVPTVVTTAPLSGSNGISGMAIDQSGNVYFTIYDRNTRAASLWKTDFANPPSLSFASTENGATSSDSPQRVNVVNVGNAALTFPIPAGGNNPGATTSFSLNDNFAFACPVVGAGSSSAGTLAAGATCALAISFAPAAVGPISGSLVLTDNALNATAPNYAMQSIPLTGTGKQGIPAINWPTPAAVPYGTILGAMQLNATASLPGAFTYSPSAGTPLVVGTQTLSAHFTPADNVAYSATSATTSLVVNKATPTNTLASSAPSVAVSSAVTFTATVASAAGAPTGTVTFYDGATLLGTSALSSGTAAYTTSALAAGTHSITASYSGDSNFTAVTSAAVAEAVEDFSVAPPSAASTSATVSPGGQATFSLMMTPSGGNFFAAPITFAVTGLPTGATATFSPASIAAGAGATNVTLTVQLASTAKMESPMDPFGGGGMMVALGLLLLPLRSRRQRVQLSRMGCWILAGIGSAVVLATLTGCGGSNGRSSGPQAQSYALTVTATSGTSSHTTMLNLTVQ